MRKQFAGAVGVVVVLALVPGGPSNARDYCSDLFIFSGRTSTPEGFATDGFLNAGTAGCNGKTEDRQELNTNWLTPGATMLRVAAFKTTHLRPTKGRVRFLPGGQVVPITFVLQMNSAGSVRWISKQIVEIPADATSVAATAMVPNAKGVRVRNGVTYAKAA